jgi:tetratricopeptide (TPR) repeat protein
LASEQTRQQDWLGAEKSYRDAIAYARRGAWLVPSWKNQLGLMLIKQNRFSEAEAVYRSIARNYDGDEPFTLSGIGLALIGQGRYDEAESAMRDAIAKNTGWSQPYYVLGLARESKGDRSGASYAFQQAAAENAYPKDEAPVADQIRTDIAAALQDVSKPLKPAPKRDPQADNNLLFAASQGKISVVVHLLAQGASITARQKDGTTALIAAVRDGSMPVTKLLIEKHIDVNAIDNDGYSALMIACKCSKVQIANALLSAGASVTETNSQGMTALMFAADAAQGDVVKLLLDHQAEADATDNSGNTALILASKSGCQPAVDSLIQRGADVNARNVDGATAIGLAAGAARDAIIADLKAAGATE